VHQLRSTQEEADTRLLFHAAHAASNGYHAIKVVSDDTDVLVLFVAFSNEIPSRIYIKSGTKNRVKYVEVQNIVTLLGERNAKALIGLHALTGCDSVSSFAGKGKIRALKLMKANHDHMEALEKLGDTWDLSDEHFQGLESFVCRLYSQQGSSSVNEIRYQLFCSKKGEVESFQLPPCAATLYRHCLRANYQARIWKLSLQGSPPVPSPAGKGWLVESVDDKNQLMIDWSDVAAAPDAVLQFLACKCSRSCNE